MAVKARWHTPDVVVDESDPFGQVASPAPVTEVGVPVVLDDTAAELETRLFALVREESRLDQAGTRCTVKDRADTSCHACPVAGRFGTLCRVGRDQESVLTRLAVISVGE